MSLMEESKYFVSVEFVMIHMEGQPSGFLANLFPGKMGVL
jgi:hypothetical protein